MYVAKTSIKSLVDGDYIKAVKQNASLKQSDSLKQQMFKTYSNLDSMCDVFTTYMKENITLLQQNEKNQSTYLFYISDNKDTTEYKLPI